jgi:hypothetical protein
MKFAEYLIKLVIKNGHFECALSRLRLLSASAFLSLFMWCYISVLCTFLEGT